MNADCRDLELLVSLRASGAPDALDAGEAARLDAHLATCAACRVELEASADALSAARLPLPSEADRRAVRDLPVRALAELHRKDARRSRRRRGLAIAGGFAVAAGLAIAVMAPAIVHKPAGIPVVFAEPQEQAWQGPDLDTLWSDAQVVDLDSSSSSDADTTGTDAAVAALDF